ncbi:MAG: hypothetical protein JXA94_06250 [Parachlamydiales bacterium]|nr:hypothetical protein [Parachlamydiales bacterium]
MKINKNILSIHPYISTSWENILTLHKEENALVVNLKDGSKIKIPNLDEKIIEAIFDAHSKYLDEKQNPKNSVSFAMPFLSSGGSMDTLANAMQHSEEQKNAPDLPEDVLKKIASVAKIFSEEINIDMPQPEPNCNCVHCQISRALQIENGIHPENLDAEVSDEELQFKLWDIQEEGSKLYRVTNPLDKNEHYSVYLGEPLGCTCGEKDCAHIKAVLKS